VFQLHVLECLVCPGTKALSQGHWSGTCGPAHLSGLEQPWGQFLVVGWPMSQAISQVSGGHLGSPKPKNKNISTACLCVYEAANDSIHQATTNCWQYCRQCKPFLTLLQYWLMATQKTVKASLWCYISYWQVLATMKASLWCYCNTSYWQYSKQWCCYNTGC
jgi:hypothetical protein